VLWRGIVPPAGVRATGAAAEFADHVRSTSLPGSRMPNNARQDELVLEHAGTDGPLDLLEADEEIDNRAASSAGAAVDPADDQPS